MKIIIVGLGKTGTLLSDMLSRENHDVTVVDSSKEKVEAVTDKYSVSGVTGSGASQSVLIRAGAETADVIVSLLPSDEANLMTCMTAKKIGTRYAVLRLESPEFANDRKYLTEQFGIDYMINQKRDTANTISRQIGLPGLAKADAFFSSDAVMLRLEIEGNSPLAGKALKDTRGTFESDVLIGAVKRGEKVYIPDGNFVIENGDTVSVIIPYSSVGKLTTTLGITRKPVKNVFIVGGGDTGMYLAEKLISDGRHVTVLDSDKERCVELTEKLPKATVAFVEDIDSEILTEEGIGKADVCVSLTGSDEKNLVISLFAWSCGLSSIITKVNLPSYEKLLNKVRIDTTISPTVISTDMLMRFIRNVTVFNEKGNDIRRIHSIAGGLAEAIEFIAYDDCRKIGVSFRSLDFGLKKGLLIAAIIRNGKVIIPNGDSSIQSGDNVIVIAKTGHGLNILNDIFE